MDVAKSLPEILAWALVHGDLGADAYEAAGLNEPEVRRLEALVTITEDGNLSFCATRCCK